MRIIPGQRKMHISQTLSFGTSLESLYLPPNQEKDEITKLAADLLILFERGQLPEVETNAKKLCGFTDCKYPFSIVDRIYKLMCNESFQISENITMKLACFQALHYYVDLAILKMYGDEKFSVDKDTKEKILDQVNVTLIALKAKFGENCIIQHEYHLNCVEQGILVLGDTSTWKDEIIQTAKLLFKIVVQQDIGLAITHLQKCFRRLHQFWLIDVLEIRFLAPLARCSVVHFEQFMKLLSSLDLKSSWHVYCAVIDALTFAVIEGDDEIQMLALVGLKQMTEFDFPKTDNDKYRYPLLYRLRQLKHYPVKWIRTEASNLLTDMEKRSNKDTKQLHLEPYSRLVFKPMLTLKISANFKDIENHPLKNVQQYIKAGDSCLVRHELIQAFLCYCQGRVLLDEKTAASHEIRQLINDRLELIDALNYFSLLYPLLPYTSEVSLHPFSQIIELAKRNSIQIEVIDSTNTIVEGEWKEKGCDLSLMSEKDEKQIDQSILTKSQKDGIPILIQKGNEYLIYGDSKGDGNWKFTKITSDISYLKDLPFENRILRRSDEKFTTSLINTLKEGHTQEMIVHKKSYTVEEAYHSPIIFPRPKKTSSQHSVLPISQDLERKDLPAAVVSDQKVVLPAPPAKMVDFRFRLFPTQQQKDPSLNCSPEELIKHGMQYSTEVMGAAPCGFHVYSLRKPENHLGRPRGQFLSIVMLVEDHCYCNNPYFQAWLKMTAFLIQTRSENIIQLDIESLGLERGLQRMLGTPEDLLNRGRFFTKQQRSQLCDAHSLYSNVAGKYLDFQVESTVCEMREKNIFLLIKKVVNELYEGNTRTFVSLCQDLKLTYLLEQILQEFDIKKQCWQLQKDELLSSVRPPEFLPAVKDFDEFAVVLDEQKQSTKVKGSNYRIQRSITFNPKFPTRNPERLCFDEKLSHLKFKLWNFQIILLTAMTQHRHHFRVLNLQNWTELNDEYLLGLAKNSQTTLQALDISGCMRITDKTIHYISKHCLDLKELKPKAAEKSYTHSGRATSAYGFSCRFGVT